MSKMWALVLLELRSLFGINKFLHTKDLAQKRKYRWMVSAWAFLILFAFFTVGLIVYGLCHDLGLAEIVPAYLTLLSSILILVFGFFGAGSRIFGSRGYDILAAMPVKSNAIVFARFFGLYVGDLILALTIMLPGVVMYGILEQPPVWFYLIALVGALTVPAIPLTISTLFGTLVMAISSRMKNKNIMQTVFSVLITLVLVALSTVVQSAVKVVDLEQLSSFAKMIGEAFQQIYPPAMWLNSAMVQFDIVGLLLFVLVTFVVVFIAVWLTARNFSAILSRLANFVTRRDYKVGAMKKRSLTQACYFRELKRYFASSVYATNTMMGPIIGTILSVVLCVVGASAIKEGFPVEFDVFGILPFVFTAIFTMMTATSVSISMEGKQIWVIKSLPISMKKLLDGKILFNLSLMLPFYIVSVGALGILMWGNVLDFVWLVLISLSVIMFVIVFGVTFNLKSHNFDWEREEIVVKQSLAAVVGGFAGPVVSILLAVAVILVPAGYGDILKAGICLLLWASSFYLYRKNNRKKLVDL